MYLQCTILLDRLVTCLSPSLLCAVIVHPFIFVSFSILSVKFMTPSLSRSRASPADSAFCSLSLSLSILIFFLSLSLPSFFLALSVFLRLYLSSFVSRDPPLSTTTTYLSLPVPLLLSRAPILLHTALYPLSLSHSQLVRYL